MDEQLESEGHLVGAAIALGADRVGSLSTAERSVAAAAGNPPRRLVQTLREMIRAGSDPLGDAFTRLRSPAERRPLGATYTPRPIIDAMIGWAAAGVPPDRIVDPGAGSGRFVMAAGRTFRRARLVAVEVDPLAALCLRANLNAGGFAGRSEVVFADFRSLQVTPEHSTLWIGNPPYVRHHQIAPDWKAWLTEKADARGLKASQLAGLHVHFYLATVLQSRPGDRGSYITSAEWLDVNYGSLVRELLLDGLGGLSLNVIDPTVLPFADAATTGAITCFEIGAKPKSMKVRRVEKVDDLGRLDGGRRVSRERLTAAPRWSLLLRPTQPMREGFVELGELCRVHRGSVTGGNAVWIAKSARHTSLPPSVLTPSVTRARELFSAGDVIDSADSLHSVVDLPVDLDELSDDEREPVEAFLRWAKRQGAHSGFVARNRRAWWSVGFRKPAPILATYMARRPPAFVRNLADVRHINVAHGIYPREHMDAATLNRLAESLREVASVGQGRTYAGGLTKFEPREMERIPVPVPDGIASVRHAS